MLLQALSFPSKGRLIATTFRMHSYTAMASKLSSVWDRRIGPQTVVVLAGATSVGKSSVAMELCRHIDGEIVVSDSVQVYRHLNIGSNKPTPDDQHTVKHHLLDISDPSTVVTTGDYCRRAAEAITDIFQRGKVPVVVGGSTMWVQWLVQGIPDAPKASPEIVQQAESILKPFESHQLWDEGLAILQEHDPIRAAKLFRNDWYRLRRYLEIALQLQKSSGLLDTPPIGVHGLEGSPSGSPGGGSQLQGTRKMNIADKEIDFRTVFISEDRENLYHTIDSRCVDMLYNGHISETAQLLLDEVLLPEFPVSKSIGYRQTIEYLSRGADSANASTVVKVNDASAFLEYLKSFCTATRNYAKRQLNWYRKDSMFLFIGMHRRHVAKEVAYLRAAEEVWHWATCPRAEFTDAVKAQVEANNALSELRARKLVPREYLPDTPAKRLALAYLLHTGEYKLPKIVQLQQKLALSNPSDSEDASVSLENVHDSAVDTNESDAETETMSNRERKKLARKERKYVVAVNLNAPRTAGSAGDRPLDIDIETKAGSTAEPVIPAWVGIIQDEALGITPEAMALYNPEWSAQAMDIRSSGESKSSTMKLFSSQVSGPENADLYGRLISEADKCRDQLFAEKRDVLIRYLQLAKEPPVPPAAGKARGASEV